MRASANVLAGVFVLAIAAATGCGDALDLGGSGTTSNPSTEECRAEAPATIPACQACGPVGNQCATADQGNCCCSGTDSTAGGLWQCYFNSGCCPAEAPQEGEPCGCTDQQICSYCGEVGVRSLVCGPNGTWISSQTPSNC